MVAFDASGTEEDLPDVVAEIYSLVSDGLTVIVYFILFKSFIKSYDFLEYRF